MRIQTPGQSTTHFEVLHFCRKTKNPCGTPHSPFTLIVLLGFKPRFQKLEEEDSKRRGPSICVPENRKIFQNLALQSIRARVLTAGPLLSRGRLYVGLAPEASFSLLSYQVYNIFYPPAPISPSFRS